MEKEFVLFYFRRLVVRGVAVRVSRISNNGKISMDVGVLQEARLLVLAGHGYRLRYFLKSLFQGRESLKEAGRWLKCAVEWREITFAT